MRFDLLDEYGTLVPFGLGVKGNRVLRNPEIPCAETEADAGNRESGRMSIWAKIGTIIRRSSRREEYPIR